MQRGWIFPVEAFKDTPSIKAGLSAVDEQRNRKEGCRIIMEVGPQLRLKANPTLATAGLFFNRFYMFHSFTEFPYELTAVGCLFLAGKVEETPKQCSKVCKMAADKFPSLFGDLKVVQEEVMRVERVLLQTLKFDLQVDHPYKFLIEYVKKHNLSRDLTSRVVQTAWTFVNDSISSTLSLQWEPQVVAIAMLHLAMTMPIETPEGPVLVKARNYWWDEYVTNLSQDAVEGICHSVLNFYKGNKAKGA